MTTPKLAQKGDPIVNPNKRSIMHKSKLTEFTDSLKRRFHESPETVILAGAALIAASSKLITATSGIKSKNAYARRMNRR